MTEETDLRAENKNEIELTIKDAQAGSEAVAQAITVLKDFYKESGMIAKEPWEFIQVSKKSAGVTLPDSPATWDSSYTGVAIQRAALMVFFQFLKALQPSSLRWSPMLNSKMQLIRRPTTRTWLPRRSRLQMSRLTRR